MKKHVVFADTKGLSLATVQNIFPDNCLSPSKSQTDSSFYQWTSKPSSTLSPRLQVLWPGPSVNRQLWRPHLAFPQPTVDFKNFLTCLKEALVQLESCSVNEHSLSGTVRVCNVSFEKAVHVRVTFNTWRSHHDFACSYVQQHNGGSETDMFAFNVLLPQDLDPSEHLEFCVWFWPSSEDTPCWDNNRGQNYRVCLEPLFPTRRRP